LTHDSKQLKDIALEQGFDRAGICDALPSPHLDYYREWVDRGLHAGMGYLEDSLALRSTPASLLKGAQSILAVSLNYRPPEEFCATSRVAKYAYGRDYHKVLKAKIKRIAKWAESNYPGLRTRPCVDSAPILERDYAWLAGLGWFGKNTLLIDTRRGSWFFIGLLLLSHRFEPDSPALGSCGSCRACIDACPTGALVIERGRAIATLNSERCISYQTIEHRGPLSQDIHGWLFGCDTCQDVCPFNKPRPNAPLRAIETNIRDFEPRPANAEPDLQAIAEMNASSFADTYAGTSFMRAGVDRLKRNVEAILQPKRSSNR
jgi:epoxyqueuosine reductase